MGIRKIINERTGLEKKKNPFGHSWQVDFPAKQATFLAHLPTGQRPRQDTFQCNFTTKGKLDFRFSSSSGGLL